MESNGCWASAYLIMLVSSDALEVGMNDRRLLSFLDDHILEWQYMSSNNPYRIMLFTLRVVPYPRAIEMFLRSKLKLPRGYFKNTYENKNE